MCGSKRRLLVSAGEIAVVALLILGATSAMPNSTQSQTQSVALTPAENCVQNAVPKPVLEDGAKVKGFRYSSVCVRPYKPDPEYAKHQTPAGETRDGLSFRNADPLWILQMAYGSGVGKVFNVPDWLNGLNGYDFEARMDPATAAALEKLSPDDRKIARQHMMQVLLADEFKLKVHKESREIAAYNLAVAEGGPKFHAEAPNANSSNGGCGFFESGPNKAVDCELARIDQLRELVEFFVGRPVVDKTGLTGWYTFSLNFRTAPETWVRTHPEEEKHTPPHAIADQLGLLLQPVTIRAGVIVIDHIERPSGN